MPKNFPSYNELLALPLYDQAIAQENERHRNRIAEIKRMQKPLEALERERPALASSGVRMFGDDISRFVDGSLYYRGTLTIDGAKMCRALLHADWVVEKRGEGSYPTHIFKKGHLRMRVASMSSDALERAEAAITAEA